MANESVKLIPRGLDFPTARHLLQEEQETYEEAVKQKFNSKKARDSLLIHINYSNLFKVIFLNQIGIKTATLPELDLISENLEGIKLLKGFYEDTPSIILRSNRDSNSNNDYLAKDLTKKLKIKSFATPIIANGLELIEDVNSAYGLNFDVENVQKINAPDFDNRNHGRKFSRINPDYSIEFDEKGTRTLYTRDNGVSRLCLDGGLYLGSGYEDLAVSGDDGRVVVVSGGATSQKSLDAYIFEINQNSAKQIKQIQQRAKQAESYIRTGKLE